MSKGRALVTGGAGFIGSHLVEGLLKHGYSVTVLDDFSTGQMGHLASVKKDIRLVRGSISNPRIVRHAVRKNDFVFHLAAIRSVFHSVLYPVRTHHVNIGGTLNILLAARDAGVKRVVFTSSSAVYGDTHHFPSQEDDVPEPASPYAVSKLAGEDYCRLFSKLYGLQTISLRYFNVFGPRQSPESQYSCVIPIFIYHLIRNRSPEVHWDGRQSRDFAFVDNIVHGNLLAASLRRSRGEVVNISAGQEHSVLDIFNFLKKLLHKEKIKPVYRPKRAGDVRRTLADISKSKKLLGFKVQTKFEEGLERTVDWFLSSKVLNRCRL